MNKNLLKWIFILLAVFVVSWVFLNFVSVKNTKVTGTQATDDSITSVADDDINTTMPFSSQNNDKKDAFNSSLDASSEVSTIENKKSLGGDYNDFSKLRENSIDGVRIVSINDAGFDTSERQDILEKINNLKMSGSMSGGEITHEFSDLNLKRGNIEEKKTSFKPVDKIIGKEFVMTSKVYSGAYSQDTGYSSIYQLYENPSNGAKIEFTEMYLDPKNNTVMEVVKETLNHSIDNVPMTFETIKTPDSGTIYNAQFNVGKNYYSFSSQGVAPDEFENVLSKVIKKEQ